MIANAGHDMPPVVVDNAAHGSLPMAHSQTGTTSVEAIQGINETGPPQDARNASFGGEIRLFPRVGKMVAE